jgi:hypothetical protein
LAGLVFLLYRNLKALNLNKEILGKLFQVVFHNLKFLVSAIILLFVNYYLELRKWQLLTDLFEKRSSSQALGDVLKGLMVGLFTPFMVGDFLGRSLSFRTRNKSMAVAVNFYNSMTQTFAAIFFGAIGFGLWVIIAEVSIKKIVTYLFIVLILASFAGLFFILKLNISWGFTQKIDFLRRYNQRSITELDLSNLLRVKVLNFSFLRNLVFFLQFYLVLLAFGLKIPFNLAFIGVNLIFLIKTVGGGLNILGDLSIREIVGIIFFGFYQFDPTAVALATFTIWFINIFLPVIFIIINPKILKK